MESKIENKKRRLIYEDVRNLCDHFKYAEAYNILEDNIKYSDIDSDYEKKHYLHALGITTLLGYNKINASIEIFERELNIRGDCAGEFIDALSTNSIGIAYFLKKDTEVAKKYFEQSLEMLEHLNELSTEELNKTMLTLYNSAKFYSEIKEFRRAISLCNIGIDLAVEENRMSHLEKLIYEKAFNLEELGHYELAIKMYERALAIAELKGNEIYIEHANKHLKKLRKLNF